MDRIIKPPNKSKIIFQRGNNGFGFKAFESESKKHLF